MDEDYVSEVNDVLSEYDNFTTSNNSTKTLVKSSNEQSGKFLDFISDSSRNAILDRFYYRYFMYAVAILGGTFVYIQLGTIIYNKSSTNVSLPAFIVFLFSSIFWLIYGYLVKDWVIILANIVNIIGTLLIIAFIKYYEDTSSSNNKNNKDQDQEIPET